MTSRAGGAFAEVLPGVFTTRAAPSHGRRASTYPTIERAAPLSRYAPPPSRAAARTPETPSTAPPAQLWEASLESDVLGVLAVISFEW